MKVHKWSKPWPGKYKLIPITFLFLMLLTVIFANLTIIESHSNRLNKISVEGLANSHEKGEFSNTVGVFEYMQGCLASGWTLLESVNSLRDAVWRFSSGILPENGYWHIASGIPLLHDSDIQITRITAEEESYFVSALISDIWKHSFEKVEGLTLSDEVQVVLYHTHNAETYLPDDGVSKVSGQNGGVVDAAKVLQDALQKKYGIRTAHSTTIHDYPDWSRSYQNSLNTAKQLLLAYPETKAIFDIHRDAGFTSKKTTTAIVNGKSAAKIMMVIGCNHENWKENLAFARRLETVCNALYPGLLRDEIRIKETGRYNQQVDGHAVLLEVGSDLNTRAEAEYAMECFAHVVYAVLMEMNS